VFVSAVTGVGLDALRDAIADAALALRLQPPPPDKFAPATADNQADVEDDGLPSFVP
jgi:hypothetical protein